MVYEENCIRSLNSDEEVVASYLMKLYGYQFQDATSEDLMYLTQLCGMELAKELHPDCVTECDKNIVNIVNMLDERQEKETVQSVHVQTPVICYRCKSRGHIAKGCKHFKCFRCHEVGHTVIGCRKRRSNASPSTSRPSVSSAGHGNQTDCAPQQFFVSHERSLRSSSPLSVDDVPQESEANEEDVDHASQESDEDPPGDSVSDCGSTGLKLQMDCVSDDEDSARDCDVGEGVGSATQDKDSDCGDTGRQIMDSDEDQDDHRPCWTYLSEDIGFDCRDMCLREFLEYLESGSNVLDCVEQAEILSAIQEEKADCHSSPYSNYYYMYQ